jgi:hypothetical protein
LLLLEEEGRLNDMRLREVAPTGRYGGRSRCPTRPSGTVRYTVDLQPAVYLATAGSAPPALRHVGRRSRASEPLSQLVRRKRLRQQFGKCVRVERAIGARNQHP